MPRYRLLYRSIVDDGLFQAGHVFTSNLPKAAHWELLEEPSDEAKKAALEIAMAIKAAHDGPIPEPLPLPRTVPAHEAEAFTPESKIEAEPVSEPVSKGKAASVAK